MKLELAKKPSRKQWLKRLDSLLSQAIRLRDKTCQKCGHSNHLGAAHYYPKGKYTRLRYDLDNVILLCWLPCHFGWAHKDIPGFNKWFEEKYPERAERLKLRSQLNYKEKIDYFSEELYLRNELKKYEKRR